MNNTIELTRGTQTRTVSEFEYNLIKDDMSGWEVKRPVPEVPKEVADRVNVAQAGALPISPEWIEPVTTFPKPRKNSKQ